MDSLPTRTFPHHHHPTARLLDTIRQVQAFGLALTKLDIRQESTRHNEAMDAITEYLGMGTYTEWDEATRMAFLVKELEGKRPLLPANLPTNAIVNDVLQTYRYALMIIAEALCGRCVAIS